MFEMLTNFRWLLDLFDIFLVAFIIYRILLLIQGTRAVQMLVGLAVLLMVYVASQIGGLYTLNWILNNFLSSAFHRAHVVGHELVEPDVAAAILPPDVSIADTGTQEVLDAVGPILE